MEVSSSVQGLDQSAMCRDWSCWAPHSYCRYSGAREGGERGQGRERDIHTETERQMHLNTHARTGTCTKSHPWSLGIMSSSPRTSPTPLLRLRYISPHIAHTSPTPVPYLAHASPTPRPHLPRPPLHLAHTSPYSTYGMAQASKSKNTSTTLVDGGCRTHRCIVRAKVRRTSEMSHKQVKRGSRSSANSHPSQTASAFSPSTTPACVSFPSERNQATPAPLRIHKISVQRSDYLARKKDTAVWPKPAGNARLNSRQGPWMQHFAAHTFVIESAVRHVRVKDSAA